MVIDQGVRKEDVGEALDKLVWPLPCPDPGAYGCEPCPSRTYECVLRPVRYVCVGVGVCVCMCMCVCVCVCVLNVMKGRMAVSRALLEHTNVC